LLAAQLEQIQSVINLNEDKNAKCFSSIEKDIRNNRETAEERL